MFTLFHFGFEIFKIAIQAAIYSAVIFFFKFILIEITGNNWLRRIKYRPIYLTIAAIMLVFSFTYYGNHGLGDEANIPLGHWKSMNSGDGYAYFYLKPNEQINVDSFLVRKDHMYFASGNTYYDYQLTSGKWTKYNTKRAYETDVTENNLPKISDFKPFYWHYDDYWNGWRFWLLP